MVPPAETYLELGTVKNNFSGPVTLYLNTKATSNSELQTIPIAPGQTAAIHQVVYMRLGWINIVVGHSDYFIMLAYKNRVRLIKQAEAILQELPPTPKLNLVVAEDGRPFLTIG